MIQLKFDHNQNENGRDLTIKAAQRAFRAAWAAADEVDDFNMNYYAVDENTWQVYGDGVKSCIIEWDENYVEVVARLKFWARGFEGKVSEAIVEMAKAAGFTPV